MATVKEVLDIARAEIGITEYPANSNNVKYNSVYYGQPVYDGLWGCNFPWCVVFLWWVFRAAGASELFCGGGRTANCGTLADYYIARGQFVKNGYRPGDIVFFSFSSEFQHVGIIESVNADGTYTCIEGNTSADAWGSQDNGGAVCRKRRLLMNICGAGRPAYDPEPEPKEDEDMERYNRITELPEWAQPTIMKLCDKNYLRGQGGPRDEAGRPADLDLSMDVIRVFVILDRAGQFND